MGILCSWRVVPRAGEVGLPSSHGKRPHAVGAKPLSTFVTSLVVVVAFSPVCKLSRARAGDAESAVAERAAASAASRSFERRRVLSPVRCAAPRPPCRASSSVGFSTSSLSPSFAAFLAAPRPYGALFLIVSSCGMGASDAALPSRP